MTRLTLYCHQHARAENASIEYSSMEWVQARKVAVSSALLGTPEVLILDEPTNHMDVQVCFLTRPFTLDSEWNCII